LFAWAIASLKQTKIGANRQGKLQIGKKITANIGDTKQNNSRLGEAGLNCLFPSQKESHFCISAVHNSKT